MTSSYLAPPKMVILINNLQPLAVTQLRTRCDPILTTEARRKSAQQVWELPAAKKEIQGKRPSSHFSTTASDDGWHLDMLQPSRCHFEDEVTLRKGKQRWKETGASPQPVKSGVCPICDPSVTGNFKSPYHLNQLS